MKIKNKYLKLFLSTFKLSACTFGGGFVIVPLMRKKFVEQLKWIEEQEMMDLTAIAQSSPGAIAVNASILVGYHVGGVPGALISIAGTVLPPLIIISVISFFYTAFRSNVVITLGHGVVKQRRILPVCIMLASFVAVRFLGINIILIILVCGIIGALDTFIHGRRGKEKKDRI